MAPKLFRLKNIVLITIAICISVIACKSYISHTFKQTYTDYNEVIHKDTSEVEYLKIHMQNGDVAIMDNWEMNENNDSIFGLAQLYDFNRNIKSIKHLGISTKSIAIVETNMLDSIRSKDDKRLAGLAIILGMDVILDVFCLINPKACFGSCPTFYMDEEEGLNSTRAESFSHAISPSLENRDIDNLKYTTKGGLQNLTMKNEALETHVINHIELLAISRGWDQKSYHDRNEEFFITSNESSCLSARHNRESIKMYFDQADDFYFSTKSDSFDLFKRDTLYLDFINSPENETALILKAQQTLMTTFLFYNSLSLMGDEIGDYMALVENKNTSKSDLFSPFYNFNHLNISIWNPELSKWELVDFISEIGPIAYIHQLIVLPLVDNKRIKIRLDMTKGFWKVDQIILADLDSKVHPQILSPSHSRPIINQFTIEYSDILYDDEEYMITYPGDEVKFSFDLPILDERSYDLFIGVKGYYLEWTRNEWLEDKNTTMIKQLLMNNSDAWKSIAIQYKDVESEMEEIFLNSKFSLQ